MKLDYSMKGDTEHRKHDKRSECHRDAFRLHIYPCVMCAHLLHTIITGVKHTRRDCDTKSFRFALMLI